jgi:RNA polymerase sigma-70 factor (ECF subfamily)
MKVIAADTMPIVFAVKKAFFVFMRLCAAVIRGRLNFAPNAKDQCKQLKAVIKVYNSLPSFRGDSAFYTWLYRIAVNTAKNYLTSQSRRPPSSDIDAMEADSYDGSGALKDTDDPEAVLHSYDIQNVIHKAIEQLPAELKSAITLRELEGMSYEEIASIEGCPIGTVRSRIFRARDAIDKQLKPLLEN